MNTAYQFRVRAFNVRGPSANSNIASATTSGPPQLAAACAITGTMPAGFEWSQIRSVVISDANGAPVLQNRDDRDTTSKYQDFTQTGQVLKMLPCDVLSANVFDTQSPSSRTEIWVDFNDDGAFSNDERVASAQSNDATMTIPANAAPGMHRMRVVNGNSSTSTACASPHFGAIEDYALAVRAPAGGGTDAGGGTGTGGGGTRAGGGGTSTGGGSGGGAGPNTNPQPVTRSAAFTSAIRHADVDSCLDGTLATDNGANATLWSCHGGTHQQATFTPVSGEPGVYTVTLRRSGRCLDVAGAGTTANANVQPWACAGGAGAGANNQQWRLQSVGGGLYRLLADRSGLALSSSGTNNGNSLTQQALSSTDRNQLWRITVPEPVTATQVVRDAAFTAAVRHADLDQCIDGTLSTNAGANATVWSCHGGTHQQLTFTPVANERGTYTVTFGRSGLCLDVAGASSSPGANSLQWNCHGGDNQNWRLQSMGNGLHRMLADPAGSRSTPRAPATAATSRRRRSRTVTATSCGGWTRTCSRLT